jgi:hypothetical protein
MLTRPTHLPRIATSGGRRVGAGGRARGRLKRLCSPPPRDEGFCSLRRSSMAELCRLLFKDSEDLRTPEDGNAVSRENRLDRLFLDQALDGLIHSAL